MKFLLEEVNSKFLISKIAGMEVKLLAFFFGGGDSRLSAHRYRDNQY